MVRFQYFSDVHTEFYNSCPTKLFDIRVEAPYLILAGDIGDPFSEVYEQFLSHLSVNFEKIFIVAGNHEYYRQATTRAYNERIAKFVREHDHSQKEWMEVVNARIGWVASRLANVVFLNNNCYCQETGGEADGGRSSFVVFGGTFWTDIRRQEAAAVASCISDYTQIAGLSIGRVRQMHQDARAALRAALGAELAPEQKMIVVSHHLPSYGLIHPKYRDSDFNSAFASDVPEASDERIVAWVAGHTHCPMQLGKFHVNPIGYPGENRIIDFNKCFEIQL